LEPCPASRPPRSSTRRDRTSSPRILRARSAAGASAALLLALLAGAAAARPPGEASPSGARGGLAPLRPALDSAGSELGRRLAPTPWRRRWAAYSGVGIALVAPPLCAFLLRGRRRERERERALAEQHARAPEVLGAALEARPLRRSAARAGAVAARNAPTADGLPPLGDPSPEVAARAAALRAASVREAAQRAALLRAASARSEARRRAAALRARSRRERDAAAPALAVANAAADAADVPALGPTAAPRATAAAPPPAAGAGVAREPAADAGVAREPAAVERVDLDPAAEPRSGAGRVAIPRAPDGLTFEWLERCLARDPDDLQARLDLCTALLVAERHAEAERVAREGLERDPTDGRLLLRLSEALCGLGHTDEALEVAVRAVRSHRSRRAVLHLTRLSALARRFAPADGPRLRRALEGRPGDPVFLHALGVFESLHGSPRRALACLRLALRHERNPRWRRSVSREIARLRAEELGGPAARRRPARPARAASQGRA
jgi:tetratricopeptide (TPR) repeat protein